MTSITLTDIAQKISATIIGDDKKTINNVAPLYRATENDLSYLVSSAYEKQLSETKAGAVILTKAHAENCPVTALIVDNPEFAYARIATLFDTQQKPSAGIHPSAVIAATAKIHSTVSIGAHCVVGDDVEIGEHTTLMPGVIINDSVKIGAHCFFYSHVTIYHHVQIHSRVMLHSGVVIGADGFGLAQENGKFEKIPQLGSVIIHDDVEIGANSCVDRGALDDTIIEQGVKIDNQVQIAHNVRVGAYTVIAGCVGIAGSTTIGRHCIIGGAATIAGHLSICDGVIFTGGASVTASIKERGIYASGTGLMPANEWRRNVVRFRQLDQWSKKINHAIALFKKS